jgi:adenylate cyclase class 2
VSAQDDFLGQLEVELKYRVKDKRAFLTTLISLKHEVMFEDNQEADWFMIHPSAN